MGATHDANSERFINLPFTRNYFLVQSQVGFKLIDEKTFAGHGDRTISNVRAGCLNLLHTVQSCVKPKYHIFGHIHEGRCTILLMLLLLLLLLFNLIVT